MLDILFNNCTFPDFKKNVMKKGSIGIENNKITFISNNLYEVQDAKEIIDVKEEILSPGFIDIHMHEEDFIHEGEKYFIAKLMLLQGVTTCVGGQCGVQKQDVKVFRNIITELGGAPVNYLLLAGYNAFRSRLGIGRFDTINEENLLEIVALIKKELEDGASGVSFGIEYDPGISTQEMIRVINAINKKNLFVAAHYRADGNKAIDSIKEMIEIQRATNCNFQISHLSSCSAMGNMKEALELINREMKTNKKLSYDTYPYNAFSTMIGTEVFTDGCFDEWGKTYHDILLTDEPYKNVRCTKEIFEECREKYPDMLAVAFVMNEDEISMAISNEYGMIASDGIINHNNGHPRAAGTFPRVLGKYVRDEKALSMVNALKKMTLLPAERLDLSQKGRIELGCDADFTIFNPHTVKDGATFENLNILPTGISYVFVNGKLAVKNNNIINDRLGHFISVT